MARHGSFTLIGRSKQSSCATTSRHAVTYNCAAQICLRKRRPVCIALSPSIGGFR
jgi:hypothetical protein